MRAKRSESGNGRVYVVHFTATDEHGAGCSGIVKVGVPRAKQDEAIEGTQLYDSFGPQESIEGESRMASASS